ncbi:Branched-chain amino acid transport system permease protein LivM (TC 3.A.1.4.1) [Actinomycetales bacterium JB111]|nr:Branched-chain amino acid transport system permease protein LivM (TC 3.A.1.4.1) [Actinomycetales bacterium JB111]
MSTTVPTPTVEDGGAAAPAQSRYRLRRWTPSSIAGTAVVGVAVLLLAYLPYVVGISTTYVLIDLFIFMILAMMWNLLAGYGGMVSIGQQAYIGLGAYGMVTIADLVGVSPMLAVPVVALLCGVAAIPISYLTFRLVGGYFAVGTWVVAEVVRLIVSQVRAVGAGSGISLSALSGVDRTLRIASVYWYALGVTVLLLVGMVLFVRSRHGLALSAVRDNEIAAAGSGVGVTAAKRVVFVAAAIGTGAAGALIPMATLRVQPDSVFNVQWAAFMIFIVVIGGLGTIEGPFIGSVIFFTLREALADYGALYLIVLGAVGVAFVLFARGGVWGLVSRGRPLHLFPVGHHVR